MPVEESVGSDVNNCAGCMPVRHKQPLVTVSFVFVVGTMAVVSNDREGAITGARGVSGEDERGPLPVEPSVLVAVDEGK